MEVGGQLYGLAVLTQRKSLQPPNTDSFPRYKAVKKQKNPFRSPSDNSGVVP